MRWVSGIHVFVHATDTHQWYIIHAEYYNALVFRGILRDTSKMRFEDMVAVEEGHFAVRFDPNLRENTFVRLREHYYRSRVPCTWRTCSQHRCPHQRQWASRTG